MATAFRAPMSPKHGPASARHRQRGAAALVVTLLLFLVLGLSLLYADRTLLVDTRTTRYQVEASQAFEAAEAGVEWMTAMLNDPHRLDDACRASTLASARSLRDRMLGFDAGTGAFIPTTWQDGSVARPMQAACVRDGEGWQCSCPSAGTPHPPLIDGARPQPSFVVALQAGSQPGTVQVTATGCNNRGPACIGAAGDAPEGKARAQALLALLPALFAPPAAALTARQDIVAPAASLGLSNGDAASGGITVDAGGAFFVPGARLTSAPGAAPALSVVEADAALAAVAPDALFARHFGMDKATWRQRPGVTRLACPASCGAQIDATLASGTAMLWVDGDLAVDGPATWGSPDKPVVVVATGAVRIDGRAAINGMLYGHGITWNDAAVGTASLQGAMVSEAGYDGTGSPDLLYDAAILRALNTNVGSWVRVPGSWKDF